MTILPAATARPEIIPIADLLDNVSAGEYRIPRFQRPYVWSPDDMLQLFDSLLKGYPIGSLLVWQTDRDDISSLRAIGPIKLPEAGPAVKSYVVDGHQRLATLLGVLRLAEDYPRDRKVDNWRWWIAYDLKGQQFVHLKNAEDNIPLHLLPLRSVIRTVDFARRTREILSSGEFEEDEANELLERADAVQRAIRDYRIPMTVMRSGSLDDAVNIFSRVNQRGRDMTPDQMVAALTFRDRAEGDFDLADSIDNVLGELRQSGFGDLQRRIVLQVVLALADLDFTRPSYEKIVNRESHKIIRPAVEEGKAAMGDSAEFLREDIGLKTSRLLPYASIIVMLSIFFGQRSYSRIEDKARQLLKKWFWGVSFNGWFAGANTTELRKAGEMMRDLAKDVSAAPQFETMFLNRPIRPFPQTYDRRSARVRASLVVQIISGRPRKPADGEEFDGFDVFADVASRDIPYFFPNQPRPAVSNPANRVILPEGYGRNARGAFTQLNGSEHDQKILASHFISREAFDDLLDENFDGFIAHREEKILKAESAFLDEFGLHLDQTADRNSEEIDADE